MASEILHSTSTPIKYEFRKSFPFILLTSPSAKALGKQGAVGCVKRP